LNSDINDNFVNNTTLSILSTSVDDQFELTTAYIDDEILVSYSSENTFKAAILK
jgi:hypothetical protein